MLDNQLFSDMEIKTSGSGRIACHKLLLAAAFPKASCVGTIVMMLISRDRLICYLLLIMHLLMNDDSIFLLAFTFLGTLYITPAQTEVDLMQFSIQNYCVFNFCKLNLCFIIYLTFSNNSF